MREGSDTNIVLVACRTGTEGNVQAQLRARCMSAYHPRYLVNLRHGGMVARSLFPGYLFAWVNASAWSMVRSLVGVRDFVRRGGQVELVHPTVIDRLRQREGPTGYVRIDGTFLPGQAVKVKNRNDWSGIYLGMSNTHKARVLFAMLGAGLELELFESDLIPV